MTLLHVHVAYLHLGDLIYLKYLKVSVFWSVECEDRMGPHGFGCSLWPFHVTFPLDPEQVGTYHVHTTNDHS